MLATLLQVDPIQAEFTLPGQAPNIDAARLVKAATGAPGDRPESVELVLADGGAYPRRGRLARVDPLEENAVRPITADARFPNPEHQLRPGQFVKIRGVSLAREDAALVPDGAVFKAGGVDEVVVIRPDNTVELRPVTARDEPGPMTTVTAGLRIGERVVVEGMDKCHPGITVVPQPWAAR